MTVFVLWIALSVAVGMFAGKRGRGSISWFFISLLVSPFLGLIFLLVSDDLSKKAEFHEPTRRCPACAELVLVQATLCKHCGSALEVDQAHAARLADARSNATSHKQTQMQAGLVVGGIVGVVLVVLFIAQVIHRL